MKLIGLTGGIGSGKTTASRIFKKFGFFIIDADHLARQAVEKGSNTIEKIKLHFGEEYITTSGELDRLKLSKLVFDDQKALQKLNEIVLPKITELRINAIESIYNESPEANIIYDAALLFETGVYQYMQKNILLVVSLEKQLKRLIQKRKMKKREALARINSQMKIEKKIRLADYQIDNNFSLKKLEHQIKQTIQKIKVLPSFNKETLR